MGRFAAPVALLGVALALSSCAVGVRREATDVTWTSALMRGYALSTTGGVGSYYFEYGKTVARTQKAPVHSVGFQAGELYPVTEQVNGLDPGTTYHYAVCAEDPENPGDAFCSPDQTFKTRYQPVVAAERDCSEGNGVRVTVTGLPPNGGLQETLRSPDGAITGPAAKQAGSDGTYTATHNDDADGTWTVTVSSGQGGGTRYVYVDCDDPDSSRYDSVVGTAQEFPDGTPGHFYAVDALSGPAGAGPGGELHISFGRGSQGQVDGRVTCLAVQGKSAVIGFTGLVGIVFIDRTNVTGLARITERAGEDDTLEYVFKEFGETVDSNEPDPPPLPGPTDCSQFPGTVPQGQSVTTRAMEVGGALVTDRAPAAP
jgi:hypothetical protein